MHTLKRAIIIMALLIPLHRELVEQTTAEAYTYQDVENWLAANPAPQGCEVYIETVTASIGKSYRIHWKCYPKTAYRRDHIYKSGKLILSPPTYLYANACDGTNRQIYFSEPQYVYLFSGTYFGSVDEMRLVSCP